MINVSYIPGLFDKSIWTFVDLRVVTIRNVSVVGKILYFSKQLVIHVPQEVSKSTSKRETRWSSLTYYKAYRNKFPAEVKTDNISGFILTTVR